MKISNTRPAVSVVRGFACGSTRPSDFLRHPVLENGEIVLGQVGHETAVAVAGNCIGGDERHAAAERRLLRRHAHSHSQDEAERGHTRYHLHQYNCHK
jgi:hypothetical protein